MPSRKNMLSPLAPAPTINAMVPPDAAAAAAAAAADENPYITALLAKASKDYPFILQHNPMVFMGNDPSRDYAETWPSTEEGTKKRPRPSNLPMGRVGVQVFRPNEFGASDMAAELLHVDPVANATREGLLKMLTPQQIAKLKTSARDYQSTLDRGESEQRAIQNAMDSALRGYAMNQWPEEANQAMGYTPEQRRMLDTLRNYVTTGKH